MKSLLVVVTWSALFGGHTGEVNVGMLCVSVLAFVSLWAVAWTEGREYGVTEGRKEVRREAGRVVWFEETDS